MEQAEAVLLNPSFTSEPAFRNAGTAALQVGVSTLNTLYGIDWDRANQLGAIQYTLIRLASSWSLYTSGMNQSQRGTLGSVLSSIGRDILYAYANYYNYTSVDEIGGSIFWYTGPSPPDPNLIQQAVNVAINFPGLPPLPT